MSTKTHPHFLKKRSVIKCQECGEESARRGPGQKYCPACYVNSSRGRAAARAKIWREANPEKHKENNKKYYSINKTKYNENSKKWKTENPEKHHFYSVKRSAKSRGIQFLLSYPLSFPKECPVLGIPLVKGGKRNSPSYDRIDNRLPYTEGNVAVISQRANWIKNNASEEELRKILHYVSTNKHYVLGMYYI